MTPEGENHSCNNVMLWERLEGAKSEKEKIVYRTVCT